MKIKNPKTYIILLALFHFGILEVMCNQSLFLKKETIFSKIDTITWNLLSELEYEEAPHKDYGTVYLPKFSKKVEKLHNKTVIIKGYLVPVDKTTWAISRNTYAACFFCGKAGPETVIGLEFKEKPSKLKLDAFVTIVGKMVINGKDVDDWMYKFDDAKILEMK